MSDEDIAIVFFVVVVVMGVLAAVVWMCYTFYDGLARVPKKYRTIEPYFAWLMLIPYVGFVVMWVLLPFKIPETMRNYFSENPVTAEFSSDYLKNMGFLCAGASTLTVFPGFEAFGLAGVIFFFIYVVRFRKMIVFLPPRTTVAAEAYQTAIAHDKTSNRDRISDLERLKKLYDNGVLTEEEFENEKRKLL